MLASLLLMFREGLEAALIIGIMLGYLGQVGHEERRRTVWIAVVAAAGACLALAAGLQIVGASLEGKAENIFEGLAMLLAVVVLTWMIFWMRYQARHIKGALEAEIRAAVRQEHSWALFSLAFLAVFREGVEMALFVTAIDSVSFVPLLRGKTRLPRQELFWHYPHYWNGGRVSPYSVARLGDWKLIRFYETGQEELYNLRDDLSERNDLAGSEPKKRHELALRLDNWLKQVDAQMSVPKPDPAR